MMDENKLNDLNKKIFENLKFEKPSDDFTEKLMRKIEQAKSTETAKQKPSFGNKFMLIFILTFGIITVLSYIFQGNEAGKSNIDNIIEKFKVSAYDMDFFSKYINISFDFSFIAKLIIGSVIILIVIDLISGSLIDRIIDSKNSKENRA